MQIIEFREQRWRDPRRPFTGPGSSRIGLGWELVVIRVARDRDIAGIEPELRIEFAGLFVTVSGEVLVPDPETGSGMPGLELQQ